MGETLRVCNEVEDDAKQSQRCCHLHERSARRTQGRPRQTACLVPRVPDGFDESMAYGGPSYSRNGEVEVGFASQKNFIGLYILRTDVMKTHKDQLKGKGVSIGKGAIRYSKPERINFDMVESMLRATVKSDGPVC